MVQFRRNFAENTIFVSAWNRNLKLAQFGSGATSLDLWFEHRKFGLVDTLIFTYLWVYQAGNDLIKNEVNVSNITTVIDWENFCREGCLFLRK